MNQLVLSNNQIEELKAEFFDESTIGQLYMERNSISKLDECSMKALLGLLELHLSSNKIESISNKLFCTSLNETLPKLQVLNLNNNNIRSLDFLGSQFSMLKSLILESNRIENVSIEEFKDLKNLEILNLGKNRLSVIDNRVFRLSSLKELYLRDLGMENFVDLNLNDFSNLSLLDVSFNSFKNISVSKIMPNMKSLSLSRTNLTTFEALNLDFIFNLKLLNTSDNSLYDVQNVKVGKLKNTDSIDFSNMLLKELSIFRLYQTKNTLKFLNLSRNYLENVDDSFYKLTSLKTIDLSNNRIENISGSAFTNQTSLSFLYVANNRIRSFPILAKSIVELNLEDNLIEEIDVYLNDKLQKLTILNLRKNRITMLNFENLFEVNNKLEEIYLDRNSLSQMSNTDFEFFNNLLVLSVELNRISTIDRNAFSNLDRLLVLNLAQNNLTILNQDTFENQLQLSLLNLSYNYLSFIEEDLFSSLYNLNSLDLSHNLLRQIDDYSFRLLNLLKVLSLDGNVLLRFSPLTFNGLESIDVIYVEFQVLNQSDNQMSLLSELRPVKLKQVGEYVYFRPISIVYNDRRMMNCRLVIEFLKRNIQVNLRADYDFVLFIDACLGLTLVLDL